MKKPAQIVCLLVSLCLLATMAVSCKKNAGSVSDTTKPEGQSIGSGTPSESGDAADDLLEDDLLTNPGKEAFDMMGTQSDEYKKMYGRSSKPLLPVYFDFDDSSISPDQGDRLGQNAKYLLENAGQRIVIEGNCDDRGTNEYNLALGEKRAQSAKDYLMQLGVEESRLRTRSFGEERPLMPTRGEASWAENRRDDFVFEE